MRQLEIKGLGYLYIEHSENNLSYTIFTLVHIHVFTNVHSFTGANLMLEGSEKLQTRSGSRWHAIANPHAC